MTYILNEAQEPWLLAMESGDYPQAIGKLCRGSGFCCLGLACELAEIPRKESQSKDWFIYGSGFSAVSDWAPEQIVQSLKLRGKEGELDGKYKIGKYEVTSLAEANDYGATFSEIAAFIRSNPTAVFKE